MMKWESGTDLKIKKGKEKHISNIITLDTETTTLFNIKGEQQFFSESEIEEFNPEIYDTNGILYIWTVGIDSVVYYGRTLEELKMFIDELHVQCKGLKATIFVHNLSFEFQFLRNIFKMKVFAKEERKVISCEIEDMNIEFRCSLCLSGLSLDKLGETFCTNTKKLNGSLDYKKRRNSKTQLTENELKYCENDCLVVFEYVSMMLSKYDNSFKKLPLTFTGIVRNELRKYIAENYRGEKYKGIAFKWWKEYISEMSNNTETFCELVQCFAGGYVHTNFFERGELKEDVHHNDFDSSYIAAALSEKFPCEKFKECDVDEELDCENFSYIITAKFTDVTCMKAFNFIQFSKVYKTARGFINDNGRLSSCREFEMTLTDCDFDVICSFYDIGKIEILSLKKARKEYLPKVLVNFIVDLYVKKCELKKTKELNPVEYALTKQQLCSIYGMMVTNTIRDEVCFDGYEWGVEKDLERPVRTKEWEKKELLKIQTELMRQKKEKTNFLSYAWGVWVSAYARRNLMKIIEEIDFDGIYCDTDSLFYIGEHDETVEKHNRTITQKIERMCEFHGIEMNEHLRRLGHFDKEKDVKEFKALNAKRYALRNYDNTIEITVSGVNKVEGAKALTSLDEFENGFVFEREFCKKNALVYNNKQQNITFEDYQGNVETVCQQFGISVISTTYKIESPDECLEECQTASAFKSTAKSTFLCNL